MPEPPAQGLGVSLSGMCFLAHPLHLAQQISQRRVRSLASRRQHRALALLDRRGQAAQRQGSSRVVQPARNSEGNRQLQLHFADNSLAHLRFAFQQVDELVHSLDGKGQVHICNGLSIGG